MTREEAVRELVTLQARCSMHLGDPETVAPPVVPVTWAMAVNQLLLSLVVDDGRSDQ
jgi:hypothetical protein